MSNLVDRDRFLELAVRYVELGQLLPRHPSGDMGIRMVLAEMEKTQKEIDTIINRNAVK
jgi:predicted amidohydrolase YtcJ